MRCLTLSSPAARPVLLLVAITLVADSVAGQPSCAPLPPPSGPTIQVSPSQADQLRGIVAGAASGTTILLEDGFYDMSGGDNQHRVQFSTPNVTLRGLSGNRSAVVLDGDWNTNVIIAIGASDITIADLTVQRTFHHPIHIVGPSVPITGALIHNVAVFDPGQQAIKINPANEGWVDFGTIECSHVELTDAGRPHVTDCYTGGIDAHRAWGWVVRRNFFKGFWCDQSLSEHAVHFWTTSRDTLVEENVIVDCARGIGFGMGQSGQTRDYPDDPYPNLGYKGHIDGIIRNNFIAVADTRVFNSQFGFDAGIGLEQAAGAGVYHNSVISTQAPFSSIEWRWENTIAEISNNVVSHNLRARNGGQANLVTNLTNAPTSWFVDVATGDLHLQSDVTEPVDGGTPLPPGMADDDHDAEPRDVSPDIGADEVRLDLPIFTDGFESGDTSGWDTTVES